MKVSRMTKAARWLGALGILALLASACGDDDSSAEATDTTAEQSTTALGSGSAPAAETRSFTVGFNGDLSGPIAVVDKPYLAGLETAFESLDPSRGLEISVEALDGGIDVGRAQANYRQLVGGDAIAIISHSLSNATQTLVPLAEQDKVSLAFHAFPEEFTEPARPYLFGTGLTVNDGGRAQAEYLMSLMDEAGIDAPKIAIFSYRSVALESLHAAATERVEKLGGSVAVKEILDPAAPDPSSSAAKIADAGVDGVILSMTDNQAPEAVQALRERGVDVPIVNYQGGGQVQFETLKDPKLFGVSQVAEPKMLDTSGLDAMRAAAKESGHEADMTGAFFTLGYVHGQLIAAALEGCAGDCDRVAFEKALGSTTLDAEELEGLAGNVGPGHKWMKQTRIITWDASRNGIVALTDYSDVE